MNEQRREFLKTATAGALAAAIPGVAGAQGGPAGTNTGDRVFIANEDSNTISVIDPRPNPVDHTINLTHFDEDAPATRLPRPG